LLIVSEKKHPQLPEVESVSVFWWNGES